jgi:D-alanyl-D-alanine dipeptidase
MDIVEYYNKPIPSLAEFREIRPGYSSFPISTEQNTYNEPGVELTERGIAGINHYFRSDNPPYNESIPHAIPNLMVRETVAAKLQSINEKLGELDLELFVFDGYRPIEVQNYFHDVWFYNQVSSAHPEWSEEEIWREVELYWAKGAPTSLLVDPLAPPPHSTGGAVDLTIRRKSGEHLWMGTIFDDMTDGAFTDYYEFREQVTYSDREAAINRRLLYWLMKDEGFENNATEWWHYSYGDQMWALFSGNAEAIYGKMFYPV